MDDDNIRIDSMTVELPSTSDPTDAASIARAVLAALDIQPTEARIEVVVPPREEGW